MLAERGLDGRPILTGKPAPRWWTYLLMAHDNTWKLRLSRGFRFTLTTRTDIPWVGFDREDRGILFTPRLGHGYWWGFDGRERTTDWTLVVGVAFMLAR